MKTPNYTYKQSDRRNFRFNINSEKMQLINSEFEKNCILSQNVKHFWRLPPQRKLLLGSKNKACTCIIICIFRKSLRSNLFNAFQISIATCTTDHFLDIWQLKNIPRTVDYCYTTAGIFLSFLVFPTRYSMPSHLFLHRLLLRLLLKRLQLVTIIPLHAF